MQYTNKLNLPKALVNAITRDPYTKGTAEISITGLLKPMRAVALEKLHSEELCEDVAERLHALYGQIVHSILERAADENDQETLTEKRLYMTHDGVVISGQLDSFSLRHSTLTDWKFVTSWKFKTATPPQEWEAQLNCYAELLRRNNYKVEQLEVIGLLRDHSKLEAKRDGNYPQMPVARMPLLLWSEYHTQKFLSERIKIYKEALSGSLPQCTPQETWAKPDIWALMKTGRKTAVKLFYDEEEAKKAPSLNDHYIVKRAGEQIRCEHYCAAKPFCDQYHANIPRG